MQSDAERVLSNLHVLGALSDNDKLITNDDMFDIYSPTTWRALLRFLKGENRLGNVQRVRTCIRHAMTYSSSFLEEANDMLDHLALSTPVHMSLIRVKMLCSQHTRMMNGLQKANEGMEHLKLTYRGDSAMAAQVELLIDEVASHLSVMQPFSEALKKRYDATSGPIEIEHRTHLPSIHNPEVPIDKSEQMDDADPTSS